MINLRNQVILITGAARGIGLATVEKCLERGANVVVQDLGTDLEGRPEETTLLQKVMELKKWDENRVLPIYLDLKKEENSKRTIDQILAKFGRIDSVIHNAGWVGYQHLEDTTLEFLQRVIDVNIYMPVFILKYALPVMKQNRYGRILLYTSDRAIYPEYCLPGLSGYAMGKMAQIGLMNAVIQESEEFGICCNCISPVAKTRMWNIKDEPTDLKPGDVANVNVFLVSKECKESGYIMRASNGLFFAVKWKERENVDYPLNIRGFAAGSPEEINDNWLKIKTAARF